MKRSIDKSSSPQISVCIVTYHAKDLLRDCLISLTENTQRNYEIIIVDNGSEDGIEKMLTDQFPEAIFLINKKNLGYTIPMNQALKLARGKYFLQLNPDTIIFPKALDELSSFMDQHPEVGICGPKVLNRDRTLQKSCRRGEPTPWAVLTYFLGLSNLFPKSKRFGNYQMSFMDENDTHPVAGVSGSCMMIRQEVIKQIGYLDERFFAYQEDADYCRRARDAGWQVYYFPKAQIIHFGGLGGSQIEPYRSIVAWHKAYYHYYRKHLAGDYCFLFNYFYYSLMFFKLIVSLVVNFFRREKMVSTHRP